MSGPMQAGVAAIPKPALILGLAGLLPFILGALGGWLADPARAGFALNAMLGYGAVILSFLGGVHWGRALAPDLAPRPPWPLMLWSVTPSLLAWGAMFTGAIYAVLVLYIVSYTIAFFVDLKAVRVGMFPAWYGSLRKILSIGVLASLFVALWAAVDVGRAV